MQSHPVLKIVSAVALAASLLATPAYARGMGGRGGMGGHMGGHMGGGFGHGFGGGYGHGFGGRGFGGYWGGYGLGYYPGYAYDDYGYDDCHLVRRLVRGPYGWHRVLQQVCYTG